MTNTADLEEDEVVQLYVHAASETSKLLLPISSKEQRESSLSDTHVSRRGFIERAALLGDDLIFNTEQLISHHPKLFPLSDLTRIWNPD